ncbi:hypothetical protein PGT21_012496 [Puccinia graminis f. sp. tritici]|uniref:Uncharacterized protein n=1 Tax=Puccinia graminis f. sp. tritici TaxID=56615 RepID=A0A5B0N8G5_PUCGR|nr:hypothetical protein PGT21_012496 [Puccinia graminis f. sp. tritici]KAA1136011.1 hypothetical protein PGTUg99_020908 [Puccinia graminis f. sp. tritici]
MPVGMYLFSMKPFCSLVDSVLEDRWEGPTSPLIEKRLVYDPENISSGYVIDLWT